MLGARVSFYSLTAVWFVASIVTGSFSVRSGVNVMFAFITVVLMVSLTKIKRLIEKANNTVQDFKPDHLLFNTLFVLFSLALLSFVVTILMSYLVENYEDSRRDSEECKITLSFYVLYDFSWVACSVRTLLTVYLNVKFSRDLNLTNRVFQMVFNEDGTSI